MPTYVVITRELSRFGPSGASPKFYKIEADNEHEAAIPVRLLFATSGLGPGTRLERGVSQHLIEDVLCTTIINVDELRTPDAPDDKSLKLERLLLAVADEVQSMTGVTCIDSLKDLSDFINKEL